MSFRIRVLLLIILLVATSTAATAWLTVRQATEQLTQPTAPTSADIARAKNELAAYARTHGTWDGADETVRTLSAELGQRLRVATEYGVVVADSDLLAGRPAREVVGTPVTLDPRPPMPTLTNINPDWRNHVVAGVIAGYTFGWPYAACLTRAGVEVRLSTPKLELPLFEAVGDKAGCSYPSTQGEETNKIDRAAQRCATQDDNATCLGTLFNNTIDKTAPARLRLYIGAIDPAPRTVSATSIAVAASAVVLAAALSALLLGRRVLRPVSALTAAAHRLGSGDLSERVPVTGRDEIADLAREFNRMAGSLADSEERQRRLIADIAHELRTPLANLRGYLEALADGVLDPDPDLFVSLHEEALLQQRIIDDLQDLALAEAGTLTYHRMYVDLTELVEVCRTAHAAVADTAGVILTADVEWPAEVYADPDRLRQAFGNLIRNAVAATPAGGRVTLTTDVNAAGRAAVTVADTGAGIAPDDLPHVFDRLWRADRARAGAGSGLGLAIARQLITDHGGTIDIASTLGEGTVVTVTLPLAHETY